MFSKAKYNKGIIAHPVINEYIVTALSKSDILNELIVEEALEFVLSIKMKNKVKTTTLGAKPKYNRVASFFADFEGIHTVPINTSHDEVIDYAGVVIRDTVSNNVGIAKIGVLINEVMTDCYYEYGDGVRYNLPEDVYLPINSNHIKTSILELDHFVLPKNKILYYRTTNKKLYITK